MPISRRKILLASAGTGILLGYGRLARMLAAQDPPAVIKRDAARPQVSEGVASGDVGHDRAIIWSRCDRPARMIVEWDTSDRFAEARRVLGPAVIEASDFTGKIDLRELPPGQR